jgi:hypothetical protein
MSDQSLEAPTQTPDKKRQMSEKVLANLKKGREIKKAKDEERRKAKHEEKEKSKIEKLKQKLVSMTLKEEPFEEDEDSNAFEDVPAKKPKAPPPAPKPRPVREKPAPRPSSPGLVFV